MLGLPRISESIKYYCTKGSNLKAGISDNGCSIDKRDKDGYCLHTKYCSSKQEIEFRNPTFLGALGKEEEKEIESKPKKLQQSHF